MNKLIELLGDMGVTVEKLAPDTYSFEAKNIDLDFFLSDAFKEKRWRFAWFYYDCILIVGLVLEKLLFQNQAATKLGACCLDTHFLGFEKLGAKFNYDPVPTVFLMLTPLI